MNALNILAEILKTFYTIRDMKWNKIIFATFFAGAVFASGCNNGNADQQNATEDSTATKEAPVLPPSGVESDQIFRTTGEVIVFFYPNNERLEALKKQNAGIEKELIAFRKFIAQAKEKAASTGRLVLESDENDIKITVTEEQINYVNALGVKAGYGIVLTKHKRDPYVIQGAITLEEFEKKVMDYYK